MATGAAVEAPAVAPAKLMQEPLDYYQTMHFNTFGYLPLRDRLAQDLAAELPGRVANIVASAPGAVSPWPADPELALRLIGSAGIADAAQSILGHDFLYVRMLCERLGSDESWHGGSGVLRWPLPHVTLFVYPEEIDAAGGCLRVIPCSHRNFLRLLDRRWDRPPDYLYGLRNPELRWQHNAFGLADDQLPSVALTSKPGDVLLVTEDAVHASFGPATRDRVVITFMANPTSEEQLYFLRELRASGAGVAPPAAMVASDSATVRGMVERLVALGFASEESAHA